MKKILNVEQIRAADRQCITSGAMTSLELMEQASLAFVRALQMEESALQTQKLAIICGTGNNGGDGLAVSRLLIERGMSVHPFLVKFSEQLSADCASNLSRLTDYTELLADSDIPNFKEFDIIIDALFGSGLSRPIAGLPAKVIESMNNAGKKIYSIDIPSGLFCDDLSNSEFVVESDVTISFQRPKLSFFLPENGAYIERWKLVDIGLNEDFIQNQESNNYVLDSEVLHRLRHRPRQSHKGSYGHALILAGSYGKVGAAVLAARACLRSGVGLLTSYVPQCGYSIMQTSVPEAMCLTDAHAHILTELPNLEYYSAIGLGPGIGMDPMTGQMLERLLRENTRPIILDADALNIVSGNKDLIHYLGQNTVLTPHIKEFDRLVGESSNSMERFEKQREFSRKNGCIIVLKNAFTSISCPEGNLYFNTSGNQGMATGGSGDVLTGVITALLAQSYSALDAALIGVYFHGKAGDAAASAKSYSALIASDIIDNLRIEKKP